MPDQNVYLRPRLYSIARLRRIARTRFVPALSANSIRERSASRAASTSRGGFAIRRRRFLQSLDNHPANNHFRARARARARNAERQTPNVERQTPHHAHCRMSFIFPAVCTIVKANRSAGKPAALEKLYASSNGTKSACIAAPKDRKHRLINSNRPNDATSLQYFAHRGRLDPTTRTVDSYRPNECSDNKSKG